MCPLGNGGYAFMLHNGKKDLYAFWIDHIVTSCKSQDYLYYKSIVNVRKPHF